MGNKKFSKKTWENDSFLRRRRGPAAAFIGILIFMPLQHIVGLIALVGASIWDIVLLRKLPASCEATN